jgi:sirohydrochlorin ferrochelatase
MSKAEVTGMHALIVAHGQPSDPGPAGRRLEALAAEVARHAPGWDIRAATLAEPGAVAREAATLRRGVVYPMFMAGGWFTRAAIPARLAEAGLAPGAFTVLEPFGCDPAVHQLALTALGDAGLGRGGEVLVAAHGSFKSAAPAGVARRLVELIRRAAAPARIEAAFIDQVPRLAEARGFGPGALCLPFFAAEGGHVTEDLPHALAEAGFAGRILPALGLHADVPRLIAAALERGAPVCAEACRMGSAATGLAAP